MIHVRRIWDWFSQMTKHGIFDYSAQSAYYWLTSIFPLFYIIATIAVSSEIINLAAILDKLSVILPESAFSVIKSTTNSIITESLPSTFSISVLIAIYSSSKGVSSLIKGLDSQLEEVRTFRKRFIYSIVFMVFFIIAIISSIIFLVFGDYLGNLIFENTRLLFVWDILRYALVLSILILCFALAYKFLCLEKRKLRECFFGAAFAAIIWIVACGLFSFYVNRFSNYTTFYAGISGIIIILLWFYMSSFVFLLGSEINMLFLKYKKTKKAEI